MNIRDVRFILASTLILFVVSGFACWHLSFRLPGDADQEPLFWATFGLSALGIVASCLAIFLALSEDDKYGSQEIMGEIGAAFIVFGIICALPGGLVSAIVGDGLNNTSLGWSCYFALLAGYVAGFLIILLVSINHRWIEAEEKHLEATAAEY